MSLLTPESHFDLSQPLFHGSRHRSLDRLRPSAGGEFGPGVYLTSNIDTARYFAKVVAQGPDEPTIYTVRTTARHPFVVRKVDWIAMTQRQTPREVQRRLREQGYDSIVGIALNDYEWQLVVFDDTQVFVVFVNGSEEPPPTTGGVSMNDESAREQARLLEWIAAMFPFRNDPGAGEWNRYTWTIADVPLSLLVPSDRIGEVIDWIQDERRAFVEDGYDPADWLLLDQPILLVPESLNAGSPTTVPGWVIADGNHRVAEALERGEETIQAYVPAASPFVPGPNSVGPPRLPMPFNGSTELIGSRDHYEQIRRALVPAARPFDPLQRPAGYVTEAIVESRDIPPRLRLVAIRSILREIQPIGEQVFYQLKAAFPPPADERTPVRMFGTETPWMFTQALRLIDRRLTVGPLTPVEVRDIIRPLATMIDMIVEAWDDTGAYDATYLVHDPRLMGILLEGASIPIDDDNRPLLEALLNGATAVQAVFLAYGPPGPTLLPFGTTFEVPEWIKHPDRVPLYLLEEVRGAAEDMLTGLGVPMARRQISEAITRALPLADFRGVRIGAGSGTIRGRSGLETRPTYSGWLRPGASWTIGPTNFPRQPSSVGHASVPRAPIVSGSGTPMDQWHVFSLSPSFYPRQRFAVVVSREDLEAAQAQRTPVRIVAQAIQDAFCRRGDRFPASQRYLAAIQGDDTYWPPRRVTYLGMGTRGQAEALDRLYAQSPEWERDRALEQKIQREERLLAGATRAGIVPASPRASRLGDEPALNFEWVMETARNHIPLEWDRPTATSMTREMWVDLAAYLNHLQRLWMTFTALEWQVAKPVKVILPALDLAFDRIFGLIRETLLQIPTRTEPSSIVVPVWEMTSREIVQIANEDEMGVIAMLRELAGMVDSFELDSDPDDVDHDVTLDWASVTEQSLVPPRAGIPTKEKVVAALGLTSVRLFGLGLVPGARGYRSLWDAMPHSLA